MDNIEKEILFIDLSGMNVDAKIVMEEKNIILSIDVENAFNESKPFYD